MLLNVLQNVCINGVRLSGQVQDLAAGGQQIACAGWDAAEGTITQIPS